MIFILKQFFFSKTTVILKQVEYFDNIRGDMLEATLVNLRRCSQIVVAEMISQYELYEPQGIKNLVNIVYKQIKVDAFIIYDYYHLYPKFLTTILPYIREGKITYVEDITNGIESGLAALEAMFVGKISGKLLGKKNKA